MAAVYLRALKPFLIAAVLLIAVLGRAAPANATLSISSAPTHNVVCNAGHCQATAPQAVLNVSQLRKLLASYPAVRVYATVAKGVSIDAALTWTSSSSLSLAAHDQIAVNKPVTVAGQAAVNIQCSELVFARRASLTFWDLSSTLSINGNNYALVNAKSLNLTLNRLQPHFYALANDWNASGEWPFLQIDQFPGVFDGLGHTISNLTLDRINLWVGVFGEVSGIVRNLNLANVYCPHTVSGGGLLAGENDGKINRVSVTGTLDGYYEAGGLVWLNKGIISNSHARARITSAWTMGGLVAYNIGMIHNSHAAGELHSIFSAGEGVGGLVGYNAEFGRIDNSYARATLHGTYPQDNYGGLVGHAASNSAIIDSYAAGKIKLEQRSSAHPGGVAGYADPMSNLSNLYWDVDRGVHNPHAGTGNVRDQPGITGLSDAQLKSGLPAGFDPKIWAHDPALNDGYPYLRAVPPQR